MTTDAESVANATETGDVRPQVASAATRTIPMFASAPAAPTRALSIAAARPEGRWSVVRVRTDDCPADIPRGHSREWQVAIWSWSRGGEIRRWGDMFVATAGGSGKAFASIIDAALFVERGGSQ